MSEEHNHERHSDSYNHIHVTGDHTNPRYRRVLWIALIINATMCVIEILTGIASQSISLLADSIDFAGDAANYGLALIVVTSAPVWRSRVALLKGLFMLVFGIFLLVKIVLNMRAGIVPAANTMGMIGALALAANLSVAALLYAWREGDANMRSVWLCTRNDAISNIAVILAALGVFGTASGWPDLFVAGLMASLSIWSGMVIVKHAMMELKHSA